MAWEKVSGDFVAKMVHQPESSRAFLNPEDMKRLAECVRNEHTKVLTRVAGNLLVEYQSDGETVFVHPERGYAPAGYLRIDRLIPNQEVAA